MTVNGGSTVRLDLLFSRGLVERTQGVIFLFSSKGQTFTVS